MGHIILLTFLVTCWAVVSAQLVGGAQRINNLTEPRIVAAANAAVHYLNLRNPPDSKELILIRILNGTQQVYARVYGYR